MFSGVTHASRASVGQWTSLVELSPCSSLQDEARIQKVTKRLHTLEEVNNNVKLLSEMLLHYSKEDSSEADKELMKVVPLPPTPGGALGSGQGASLCQVPALLKMLHI